MTFEIGDKVLTTTGLYISGEWRERGLKGKLVDISTEFGGLLAVKFKGIEELRFLRPEYLIVREKNEIKRPFKKGSTVFLTKDVSSSKGAFFAGTDAVVLENIENTNMVLVQFPEGAELTVVEEVLTKTKVVEDKQEETGPEAPRKFEVGDTVEFAEDTYHGMSLVAAEGTYAEVIEVLPNGEVRVEFDDYTTEVVSEDALHSDFVEEEAVPDLHEVKDNPEVQDALQLVLDRLDEIKALLTQGPRHEVTVNVHPSYEDVASVADALEEEPAPEPVFKKAKEVKAGDMLYTEGGAYDKVSRVETKDSGYTSLYGAFGNKIVQVPSGRPLKVLEEVA